MADLLLSEMEAGALGLSSGLEYDPGSFSATEEVVELARVAAAHGGRYISHIRSEDRYFWEAIEEIVHIGREAQIPVQVTHIKLAMNRLVGAGRASQDPTGRSPGVGRRNHGGLAGSHPRGFGAFTRFLRHYIRDRNIVSLEEGVRKMTSLSAQHVGIPERGSIQEGHYADLVVFDPETVMDRSTYEDPHVPSLGIEKVWVNGELVFDGGETTGNRPGRPVRRAGP